MKKQLTLFMAATALAALQHATAQSWNLAGNGNAATSSKLGTTNSVPLNFYTDNAQRATITALGRVGIGIASPINILTVKASGGVPSGNWTNVSTQIFYGFAENANGEFNIGTATNTASQRSLIQGKRARGTLASPAVVQNNDYLASIIASGYDGSAFQNPAEVDFYVDGTPSSGHVPGRISFVTGTSISDRLERLKIGSTGDITVNTNQLFVQASTGNVGIGFTSPTYKLYVNAGSTSGIYASTSGSYGVVGISTHTSGYGLYGSGGLTGLYASGSTYGVYANGGTYGTYSYGSTNGVYGYSSITATTSFGVNGSGYRGVNGTGTYGVYGTGTSYGVFGSGSSFGTYGYSTHIGAYGSGTDYGVYAESSSTVSGSYGVYGVGYDGVFGRGRYGVYGISRVDYGNAVRCTATGVGAYGLNATSASAIGVYGYTGNSNSFAGWFQGDLFHTGAFIGSDAKLKRNIKSFDNAMDIINRLQPKNYEYRNDGNYAKMNFPSGTHYGLVAQDLEKVLPNLVKETQFNTANVAEDDARPSAVMIYDKDGNYVKPTALQPAKEVKGEIIDFKAVNYSELIPIIIKGMQEQQGVITKQQAQITDQQQQINDLKELVKQLSGIKDVRTSISSVTLEQNNPNPLDNYTNIRYSIPGGSRNAQLIVTDISGKKIKQIELGSSPAGVVNFDASALASGSYTYSILVDGRIAETKKMVVAKSLK